VPRYLSHTNPTNFVSVSIERDRRGLRCRLVGILRGSKNELESIIDEIPDARKMGPVARRPHIDQDSSLVEIYGSLIQAWRSRIPTGI